MHNNNEVSKERNKSNVPSIPNYNKNSGKGAKSENGIKESDSPQKKKGVNQSNGYQGEDSLHKIKNTQVIPYNVNGNM